MTPEQKRKEDQARVNGAWAELSTSPAMETILALDLQVYFNPFRPSFSDGDEHNTHKAAIRDGEKRVVSHILKKLKRGNAALEQDEDSPARPTEAKAEFTGIETPTTQTT